MFITETILLLEGITYCNAPIQKIVVFEGALERLFMIAAEEGLTLGGIIVEDCLRLINALLIENASNQVLIRYR